LNELFVEYFVHLLLFGLNRLLFELFFVVIGLLYFVFCLRGSGLCLGA